MKSPTHLILTFKAWGLVCLPANTLARVQSPDEARFFFPNQYGFGVYPASQKLAQDFFFNQYGSGVNPAS